MNKQNLLQITRFLVGGGAGVLVYYITLYALTEFAGLWYVASSVIGSVLNTAVNFVLQKFWTFRNKDKRAAPRQMVLYLILSIGIFSANTGLLFVLVEYAHFPYLLAQLILTALLSIVSFVATKGIFANRSAHPEK